MSKTLIVRTHDNQANFSVNGNEEKISAFIKWADTYHHGRYDGSNAIICDSSIDLFTCKQKAIHEGLLACVSKDEIKARFASM